jgi:hypothetical protein
MTDIISHIVELNNSIHHDLTTVVTTEKIVPPSISMIGRFQDHQVIIDNFLASFVDLKSHNYYRIDASVLVIVIAGKQKFVICAEEIYSYEGTKVSVGVYDTLLDSLRVLSERVRASGVVCNVDLDFNGHHSTLYNLLRDFGINGRLM